MSVRWDPIQITRLHISTQKFSYAVKVCVLCMLISTQRCWILYAKWILERKFYKVTNLRFLLTCFISGIYFEHDGLSIVFSKNERLVAQAVWSCWTEDLLFLYITFKYLIAITVWSSREILVQTHYDINTGRLSKTHSTVCVQGTRPDILKSNIPTAGNIMWL